MKVINKTKRRMWEYCFFVSTLLLTYTIFSFAIQRTLIAADFPAVNDTELINAINAANDETTNPGRDTIILAPFGTYTLNAVVDSNDGNNGLPSIISKITIEGNGSQIMRSKAEGIPDFRIFHVSSSGNLTTKNLIIHNGQTPYYAPSTNLNGGGIFNRGKMLLIRCSISENRASYGAYSANGGGISNEGGTMDLINCTVNYNQAGYGGGLYNSGSLKITNSTIFSNDALGWIPPRIGTNRMAGRGGGIFSQSGIVELVNNTISGNNANPGYGCCIVNNPTSGIDYEYGDVTATNTIVAKQRAGINCKPISSKGHNLDSDGTCGFTGDGDLANTDPLFEKFLNIALTTGRGHFPLRPGSPAIDAGNNAFCPETDQFDKLRPVQGKKDGSATCDIGAIEYYPIVNEDMVDYTYSHFFSTTPVPPYATAGTLNITATFRNTSGKTILHPFFEVIKISHGVVLNIVGGGVGATLTPDVGDDGKFSDNESITVKFIIGLKKIEPISFFVYLRGGIY